MAMRALGSRIRELRERRELTREILAKKAHLSAVYVKKLEAGERLSPSLPALERIARALGARLVVDLVAR